MKRRKNLNRLGICLSFLAALLWSPLTAAQPRSAVVATPAEQQQALRLAAEDHAKLLTMLIERYDGSITDYTGVLNKTERLKGKLTPRQRIAFKFRQKPFSVYMEWLENPLGAHKLLYVEGRHGGKMLAHPTGLMSWTRSVKIDPEGKQAAKSSLYPVTWFGFRSNMLRTLEVYKEAAEKGHVKAGFAGPETIDGRKYITLDRTLPSDEYENPRLIIRIDLEYLLPTRIIAYDASGNLISSYAYNDLTFNTHMTDKDFDAKEHRLN